MEKKQGIHNRLFLGCELTSELRMHLKQSFSWKEAQMLSKGLTEAHFEGKNYIGQRLEKNQLTLMEIKSLEKNLKRDLNEHCPNFDAARLKIIVFTEVFVA